MQYSVRRFVEMAANELGIRIRWEGEGVEEKGIVDSVTGHDFPAVQTGNVIVRVDPKYYRPTEVETLLGDPSRAHQKLGWTSRMTIDQIVTEMVAHDLEQAKRHALLKKHGYDIPSAVE